MYHQLYNEVAVNYMQWGSFALVVVAIAAVTWTYGYTTGYQDGESDSVNRIWKMKHRAKYAKTIAERQEDF